MKINISKLNLGGFTFSTNSKRTFNKRKSYCMQMKSKNAGVTLKFVVIEVGDNCCRVLFRKMTDSQLNLL
jgi:hypothetical protein